eukprot:TRINITY_DN3808_c0_g1_i1.p1 TRINITY_DN3808_c0_g1~~TRINITY_DN3808_c0_g1_i1.p1  ORF type:complete len:116 (-),score=30.61 TRINITY_DN3808_c0_g1_i1:154-471(-)
MANSNQISTNQTLKILNNEINSLSAKQNQLQSELSKISNIVPDLKEVDQFLQKLSTYRNNTFVLDQRMKNISNRTKELNNRVQTLEKHRYDMIERFKKEEKALMI